MSTTEGTATTAGPPPDGIEGLALTITLPGVVSWPRPRLRANGSVGYSRRYAEDRAAWAAAVAHAVTTYGWTVVPRGVPVGVRVLMQAWRGRQCDLDRVCTAVCDALQRGGAIGDDRDVWSLRAERRGAKRGQEQTRVQVVLGLAAFCLTD